jgi:hypothetical protein
VRAGPLPSRASIGVWPSATSCAPSGPQLTAPAVSRRAVQLATPQRFGWNELHPSWAGTSDERRITLIPAVVIGRHAFEAGARTRVKDPDPAVATHDDTLLVQEADGDQSTDCNRHDWPPSLHTWSLNRLKHEHADPPRSARARVGDGDERMCCAHRWGSIIGIAQKVDPVSDTSVAVRSATRFLTGGERPYVHILVLSGAPASARGDSGTGALRARSRRGRVRSASLWRAPLAPSSR